LVGAAVKVTEVPEQMVEAVGVTVTEGVTKGFTVMVTAFEVALVGDAQLADEVITQVTMSPCTKVLFVYEVELVPTLPPFNFH
jgi:hypothetical protein